MKRLNKNLRNSVFRFMSILKYIFNIRFRKFKFKKPINYELVFEDNFETLNMDNWRLGQPWHWFHPSNLHEYSDFDMKDTKVENNILYLYAKQDSITVIKKDLPSWIQTDEMDDIFIIPNRIGMLTSKNVWKYGIFEADVKLPIGKNLWPAFWLTGHETWPPEIDIFEAYSGSDSNYIGKLLFRKRKEVKIEPNLHYGFVEDNTKDEFGAISFPVKYSTSKFINYKCHWEEDFIKIYYDNYLVFETFDKEILKWFNQEMMVVLSNGTVNSDITDSLMKVKNFKIWQKK